MLALAVDGLMQLVGSLPLMRLSILNYMVYFDFAAELFVVFRTFHGLLFMFSGRTTLSKISNDQFIHCWRNCTMIRLPCAYLNLLITFCCSFGFYHFRRDTTYMMYGSITMTTCATPLSFLYGERFVRKVYLVVCLVKSSWLVVVLTIRLRWS